MEKCVQHFPGKQTHTHTSASNFVDIFGLKCTQKIFQTYWIRCGRQAGSVAKFRHFGKILNSFGNYFRLHVVFGILLNLLWQILGAIWQIFFHGNDQNWKIIYTSGHTGQAWLYLTNLGRSRRGKKSNKFNIQRWQKIEFEMKWITYLELAFLQKALK